MSELSSEWGGLSPHLIASFWEVDKMGKSKGGATVKAPLSEANLEATLNWQSPFEQMGPETKAPTLFAMLQSGAIQPVVNHMEIGKSLQQFEGRTGITKLNSTQVFNGMPPVKFQVTAVFRAWANAQREVMAPFDQLMEWALPIKLAKDGTILSLLDAIRGTKEWVEAVLPSEAPTLVGMHYKGRTYAPLVIESIGQPLSSPIDESGNFMELSVPLTLCSLSAWDRGDWAKIKRG